MWCLSQAGVGRTYISIGGEGDNAHSVRLNWAMNMPRGCDSLPTVPKTHDDNFF